MSAIPDQRLLGSGGRRSSWLQRIMWAAFAALFAIAAFFFITVALVAGALLAVVIAARWWWIMRRIRARATASQALEGEYRVVENPPAHTQQMGRSELER